jgi:2-polyprenyl-3-methyl-5-hydroxy-6-metoxy-1,4-benzoquinol methylase
VDAAELRAISTLLEQYYFSKSFTPVGYLASDEGKNDMRNHLVGRLNSFRNTVIPWLNDAQPLAGRQVLEVGCGTGSSTVALAEQGARVTAIDIDVGALTVAKERCRVYGLDVTFLEANATEIRTLFSGQHFDLIIFFAVLEHMTHDERMIAMNNGWNMLSKGDLWCVIETSNRLWFYDGDTSFLPFYLWLPDDVAFQYSQFSRRKSICDLSRTATAEAKLLF